MKARTTVAALLAAFLWVACTPKETKTANDEQGENPQTARLEGDRTIYGLTCEGSTDSVLILLPDGETEPIRFNITEAARQGRILGEPKTGDWTGVVPQGDLPTPLKGEGLAAAKTYVAEQVVDLEELKGIWCYIVMPKLRDVDADDSQAQARGIRELSDSIRNLYFIPREYGFAMMRHWAAKSVGYIQESGLTDKDNPVVYPRLGYFTGWRIWNGDLIIMSGTPKMVGDSITVTNQRNDTCRIDFLRGDSLVLSSEGISRSYYRKSDINEVNKKAKAIAAYLQQQTLEKTTK